MVHPSAAVGSRTIPDPTAGNTYDVVGIGFGPANLALAAALTEQAPSMRCLFLEKQSTFAWHPGMLLPGARMQVSFLKDLATLRDPGSRFTYLAFLKAEGRLDEFINLGTFRPSRVEFNNYLCWAARQLASLALYEQEVLDVHPVTDIGPREVLQITARDRSTGGQYVLNARNVVVATGGRPRVPPGIATEGARVFHTASFLPRLESTFSRRDAPYRFVVYGEGQSAAEAFSYLMRTYPNSAVCCAMRGIGFRPMDESPFVNEVFFPRSIDAFYAMLPEQKRRSLASVKNTNYAVADLRLIEEIYRDLYEASAAGRSGLEILPHRQIESVVETGAGALVRWHDCVTGESSERSVDAVILATGYAATGPHPVLAGLAGLIQTEAGSYSVSRAYRVSTDATLTAGIYLQGHCQESHGISDTLLSNMAVRASDIVCDIQKHLTAIGSCAGARRSGSNITHADLRP